MTIWHILFAVAAYLSAALCLVTAIRQGWPKGLPDILVFVLFVIGYWLLESWATHMADFYFYPPVFWDMIPYFDWGTYSWFNDEGLLCPQFCPVPPTACPELDTTGGISLSVPLMEASLTFVAMWTARLLAPRLLLLWPFMVGLAVLCVDVFLDPVASTSVHCVTKDGIEAGLHFWEWNVHHGLGIQWFGIPLFNYAAWYCAPIAAVAAALLLHWARDLLSWLLGASGATPPSFIDLLLRGIIFWAFTLLFALSPIGSGTIQFKIYTMIVVLIVSIVIVIQYRSQYVHTNARRWELIIPLIVFYLFGLLGLLLSGALDVLPLLFVGVVCLALGLWYCLSPYSDT
jgi:hypothetical protein